MRINLFNDKRLGNNLEVHGNLHGYKCGQLLQSFINFFKGKVILLLLVGICFSYMVNAQISKSVEVTPGSLFTLSTTEKLSNVTNLTLTGTMDERDFITMRLGMPLLETLDLSGV